MGKHVLVAIVSLLFAATAWAGEYKAEGTVNAVKADAEKLNISHGDIKGLMSGMTMDFKVADPSMLDDVEAGSMVKFTIEEDNGNMVITDLEVTGSSSKSMASGESHKH